MTCAGVAGSKDGADPCGVSVLFAVSRNSAFGVLPPAAGPTNSARLMLLRAERSALSEGVAWRHRDGRVCQRWRTVCDCNRTRCAACQNISWVCIDQPLCDHRRPLRRWQERQDQEIQ